MHLLECHLVQPDLLVHFLHLLFESAQLCLFIHHLSQVPIYTLVMHKLLRGLLIRKVLIFLLGCLQAVVVVIFDEVLLEIVDLDDVLERLCRCCVRPVALELRLFMSFECFGLFLLFHLDA